ncbi:hypothetical protein DY000_02022838 [Brassica cretica]|uniref:Uncharacterized protein n=1 Tax=Brassica cretica TaxID=69181 RepID=A0ABQ7E9B3_BRACR|nr:hypothetical protein DY000_02022838 [Brassica cretica]
MVRRPYKISACERPCWRVPASSAGFCLILASRPRHLVFKDHCLLLMKFFSTSKKRVVTFIHWRDQVRRSPVWLSVSLLRPLLRIRPMYPLRRSPCAPLSYPRDHWLIPDKVLGDLVYVRQGTRVLRGPGLASRCNVEGLRGRPCGAVKIGSLRIPRVLGMIQGPPSPE